MKPIIFRIVLCLCFLVTAVSLQAQQRKAVSLEEAIALSLKNSKQLKLSASKIEEANAKLKQAEDARLPEASVSGAALWLPKPNVQLDESLKSNNSGGGQQSKPISVSSAFYGMLSVSQPLYAGGRIRAGIESARYLAEATKLDADHDREAIIENTILAYTSLYKADAAINVVRESLEESRQRVKDYTSLEANGVLARNDFLKAELEASNLELSLLEAEKDRKLANVNLNILLGLPEGEEWTAVLPVNQLATDKSLEEWENLATSNRKDIAALQLREKAATGAITAAKGEKLPSLALTGGYVAADLPGFATLTNVINLGVGVKYNIASIWKTKAKIAEAEARQKQVVVSQGLLNDQIRIQLNKDYQDAILSVKKISVLEKSVEQANETYRIVKNKFTNSLATTTEVLDANVTRLRAQLNYEFAKADAQVSQYKLAQTAGTLSGNFKIEQ